MARNLLTSLRARNVHVALFPRLGASPKSWISLARAYPRLLGGRRLLHFNVSPSLVDLTLPLIKVLHPCPRITVVHGISMAALALEEDRYDQMDRPKPIDPHGILGPADFDAVVVNSHFAAGIVQRIYDLPPGRLVEIPNGVEERFFSDPLEVPRWPGSPNILYLGRLSWSKGPDLLIRAMGLVVKRVPGALLHVVGDGPEKGDLMRLARDHVPPGKVIFHGYVPLADLPSYYAAADIYVAPLRMETFGIAILEAMASGLPVIATRVGSVPELIDDGHEGTLVPPGDVEALADTLVDLSMDRERAEILGVAGRLRASSYTWERVAERYIGLYCRIVEAFG